MFLDLSADTNKLLLLCISLISLFKIDWNSLWTRLNSKFFIIFIISFSNGPNSLTEDKHLTVLKPKFSLSLPLSLSRNAKAFTLFKKLSVFMINFNLYSFSDGICMFLFEYVILNVSMMRCLRKCSTSIKERMYILCKTWINHYQSAQQRTTYAWQRNKNL